MAAGPFCVNSGAVWHTCELSVAVYFGREKADVCERNIVVIFIYTTLHNIAPAFAELNGVSNCLIQGVEGEKRFFFFRFGGDNRRFVTFECDFYFFSRNFGISFSAGKS